MSSAMWSSRVAGRGRCAPAVAGRARAGPCPRAGRGTVSQVVYARPRSASGRPPARGAGARRPDRLHRGAFQVPEACQRVILRPVELLPVVGDTGRTRHRGARRARPARHRTPARRPDLAVGLAGGRALPWPRRPVLPPARRARARAQRPRVGRQAGLRDVPGQAGVPGPRARSGEPYGVWGGLSRGSARSSSTVRARSASGSGFTAASPPVPQAARRTRHSGVRGGRGRRTWQALRAGARRRSA
jgi:hypothetical protein